MITTDQFALLFTCASVHEKVLWVYDVWSMYDTLIRGCSCIYVCTGYNFNLVTRIRKGLKGTLRSSVGLAELSQSLHHLLHDLRWRRNDHSDVSRGVEAHSR